MVDLPAAFLSRMKAELGESYNKFYESYNLPSQKAIRVNTLKISVADFKKISPFVLDPVPWEEDGFYVAEESPGKTVLHAAGAYYVQEPSQMAAVPLLGVCAGERVLDLCSAPGGKGTQIAQKMHGEGLVILNEINFTRAKILSQNVERLGIQNAVVTCASPEKLLSGFKCYFDKILVDAPCSGEGMFKKEPNAVAEWSEENVRICAVRQTKILDCAAEMLRGGGRLVYSTCTFSREEDEKQTELFLKTHKDFGLITEIKLYPHTVRGEGHYAAVFEKSGGEVSDCRGFALKPPDKKQYSVFEEWAKPVLKRKFGNLSVADGALYSIPADMPFTDVQILRAGVRLGEFEKDRFIPSHSLAMCLGKGDAATVEADGIRALDYLKGLTFDCGKDVSGFAAVTYLGLPLGWCKAVNGTAKNHLPKGLRIT